VRIGGDLVKLGVQAPAAVEVHRQEVFDAIQRGKSSPITSERPEGLTDNPAP
jgi:carbon storage regulator CsrA